MRLFAIFGAICLVTGPAQMASAKVGDGGDQCSLQFAENSATITMLAANLGPGGSAFGEQAIRVIAEGGGANNGSCRGTLRISRLSGAGSFPDYRLTARGRPIAPSISEAIGDARNQLNLSLSGNKASRSIDLRTSLPTGGGLVAGRHSEQLQLTLLDASGEVADRMALNVVLEIPKAVDVMLVGATGDGQTASIDLGDLSQTEASRSAPFGLRIWSTSAYTYGFSSANGGSLRHALDMDTIPYQLFIEGRPIMLSAGRVEFSSATPSAARGDLYRLGIQVPARRSIAGRYSDRITVSVSAI